MKFSTSTVFVLLFTLYNHHSVTATSEEVYPDPSFSAKQNQNNDYEIRNNIRKRDLQELSSSFPSSAPTDECNVTFETGEVLTVTSAEGVKAKTQWEVVIGENSGKVKPDTSCISSWLLQADLPEGAFSIMSELYDPVLTSDAPSMVPTNSLSPSSSPTEECNVFYETGQVLAVDNGEGVKAKTGFEIVIGENSGKVKPDTSCISSWLLQADLPEGAYSIISELYDPLLTSDAPSMVPTNSLFPSSSPTEECNVFYETGEVLSVNNDEGVKAKAQFEIIVGENSGTSRPIDSCVSSWLLEEDFPEGVFTIMSELYEPVLTSDAPSSEPTSEPSSMPSSKPSDSPSSSPTSEPSNTPTVSGAPSLTPTTSMSPSSAPTEECNVFYETGEVLSVNNAEGVKAKAQFEIIVGENSGTSKAVDECVSSWLLEEDFPEGVFSIMSEMYKPILTSDPPSMVPSSSLQPTVTSPPSSKPSDPPTSVPTSEPSNAPSTSPSSSPTSEPSNAPTSSPTSSPTSEPSSAPSVSPTSSPTSEPSNAPSASPSSSPTSEPSNAPSASPTSSPTSEPSNAPSASPTSSPTSEPSIAPTASPTSSPTSEPSNAPSASPTASPTSSPTSEPSNAPSASPTSSPTYEPSATHDVTAPPNTSPTSCPAGFAQETGRARECGARGGPAKCCPGLVCHKYQTWRCVKPENKQCSGHLTYAIECGSSSWSASPKCCPGLTCKGKKCVEPTASCAPENKRSKYCGAEGGEDVCCTGLVCHKYQTWRCVKPEKKRCADVGTKAKQCGSAFMKGAPVCCPGLVCDISTMTCVQPSF